MSNAAPLGAGAGDPCVGGPEGGVPASNKCGTSTPAHSTYLQSPSRVASPVAIGTPPRQGVTRVTHPPRATGACAGVNCLVEYLRLERQVRPLPIDPHLFPEGLQPGDVVEVWGNSNCGKSMLALTLAAKALLPTVWSGIELGGCNTGVTFIDCDQHFSIFQLVNMMYKRVKAQLKLARNALRGHKQGEAADTVLIHNVKDAMDLLRSNKGSLKTKIEEMVQSRLKSLYYIKCVESVQFPVILSSMDEHLAEHSDVSLVMVDSLSAFTWYDRIYRGDDKLSEFVKYYDRVLSVLVANIRKYRVVLLAVKQVLFLKSCDKSSRKDETGQEEEEEMYQEQEGKGEDDDDDMDMEESDDMENMALSEYLGNTWVSSVTCQVILSQMRVNSRRHLCVPPRDVVAVRTRGSSHNNGKSCKGEGVVFFAEVIKGKQRRRLSFEIGEEGVVWRQTS